MSRCQLLNNYLWTCFQFKYCHGFSLLWFVAHISLLEIGIENKVMMSAADSFVDRMKAALMALKPLKSIVVLLCILSCYFHDY